MRAVLLSIQPEWCELIATGKKTLEVRKTKPKLEPPFKCYIYCTKGDSQFSQGDRFYIYTPPHDTPVAANQSIIGEFICDAIIPISVYYSNPDHHLACRQFPDTGLTDKQIMDYLGNGKEGYGWHISNLKIYTKPQGWGRFIVPSKTGCCNEGKCRYCQYLERGNGHNIEDDCLAGFNTDEYKPLRRPPQSWCYVEEIS